MTEIAQRGVAEIEGITSPMAQKPFRRAKRYKNGGDACQNVTRSKLVKWRFETKMHG